MPVKLGSALYKFRKAQGLLEDPKAAPVKIPSNRGESRLKVFANWSHPTHGDFFNITATDLVSMFPSLKLDQANLSRVKSGKQKSHKGWSIKKTNAEIIALPNVANIGDYSEDLLQRGA